MSALQQSCRFMDAGGCRARKFKRSISKHNNLHLHHGLSIGLFASEPYGLRNVTVHASKSAAEFTFNVETYQQQPALLTARIQKLDNLKTAEKVLVECGAVMNVVNLTAFLAQLARICQREKLVSHIQSFPTTSESDIDEEASHVDAQLKELDSSAWNDDSSSSRKVSRTRNSRQPTSDDRHYDAKLDPRERRLKLMRTTEKALKLLRPLLVEMDSQGLVVVLNALARMNARYTITHDLLYLSMTFMDEYDARSFSTLIYSVALLRVSPGREWLAAFFRHTLPLLPSFNDQAIANTLWALARLRLAPGTNTSSRDWEKELYRVMCDKLPNFSSQAVSMTCWSLGTMNLAPPETVKQALCKAVLKQLSVTAPQGVANMLWGLGKLRAEVGPSFWQGMMQATYSQLPSYSPVVLSTLLYGMSFLGKAPSSATPTIIPEVSMNTARSNGNAIMPVVHSHNSGAHHNSQGERPAQPNDAGQRSTSSYAPQRRRGNALPTSSDGAAATTHNTVVHHDPHVHQHQTTLISTAALDALNPSQLEDAWGHRFQTCLCQVCQDCSPYTLSTILYSWGKLRTMPQQALLEALIDRTAAVMPRLSSQGLSNVIWALAWIGATVPLYWQQSFLIASYTALPNMSIQELANTLWALSKLHVWPDRLWMSRYEQCSKDRLEKMSASSSQDGKATGAPVKIHAQNLSFILHSMAVLRYAPGREWQSVYLKQLRHKARLMRPMQAADTLWALAELRVPAPKELAAEIADSITGNMALLSATELAPTLYAMTRLQIPISPAMLSAMVSEIGMDMQGLSLQSLAQVAWSLACNGFKPGSAWLDRLDQHVSSAAHAFVTNSSLAYEQQQQQANLQTNGGESQHGSGRMSRDSATASTVKMAPSPKTPSVRVEDSIVTGGSRRMTLFVDSISQYVVARQSLGPFDGAAMCASLQFLLARPDVLNAMTAPQMLLVIQALSALGPASAPELLQLFMGSTSDRLKAGSVFNGMAQWADTRQQPVQSYRKPPPMLQTGTMTDTTPVA